MHYMLKKQQFLAIFSLFFVFGIVNFFLSEIKDYEFEKMVKMIAIVAIGVILYIGISVFLINYRVDGYFIFMAMSFVFMFGQHLLVLLDSYPEKMELLQNKVLDETVFKASQLILNSFLFVHLGYIFTGSRRRKDLSIPDKTKDLVSRECLMKVGKIVFFIVLIPTLVTLGYNIYLTITLGYGERVVTNAYSSSFILRVSSVLESFMVPALLAMFIAKKEEQKFPIVFIFVYVALYLISGSRMRAFILLIEVLYVYIRVHKKVSKKLFFKLLVLLLVGVLIFGFISSIRTFLDRGHTLSESIVESIEKAKENNPLVDAVAEAGYTFMATAVVVEKCPENVEPIGGRSYLSAIAYVLPNFFTNNYFGRTPGVDDTFKKYIAYGNSGIGSSYIAEAYFNFEYGLFVLMMIYGFILGKMSEKIEDNIFLCDFLKLFLYMGMFGIIIVYVRSDTRTFFRNFVWFYLTIYYFSKTLPQRKKRRF